MSTAEMSAIGAEELRALQAWVGKTELHADDIAAGPLKGLRATLDLETPEFEVGAPVPPLWHWAFFLPQHLQRELGPDGHARRGGFLPPVPLPRRMWAGGDFEWHEDNRLRVGERATRLSSIESVAHKKGASGDLVFVTVRHEFRNAQGPALQERHHIVYRAATGPGASAPAPTAAERDAAWQREIRPDPVLLFRYSALTFNGHRIHYDRTYAAEVEGYPGLVVHGPLIATLLIELVRQHRPGALIKRFDYKAVRPTFDLHPFFVKGTPADDGRSVRLWAHDHEGWLTMQARAELA